MFEKNCKRIAFDLTLGKDKLFVKMNFLLLALLAIASLGHVSPYKFNFNRQMISRGGVKLPIKMSDEAASASSEAAVVNSEEPAVPAVPAVPEEPTLDYIMCTSCKSAFICGKKELGDRGARVKCSVCEKEWFQSSERLMKSGNMHHLSKMTDTKISEIRQILADRNFPKYPKVDKVGVFVGNLPYTWTEKEIGDIFGEYGVTNIALVKDNEGQSKGFAFVETSCAKDAEIMIQEMHLFYAEANRKLTVRLSTPPSARGGGGGGGDGGGGRSYTPRGGGGAGGAGGAAGGGGGARQWSPSR